MSSTNEKASNPLNENPAAWLAAIVESSDDAVIGKTLDGVIRVWNSGAMRMFGYEAHEIIGRSVLTLIPADRRHEEKEIVARLARGERVAHFETVRLRKDATEVEISLSVSPIQDKMGRIVGAAKIARDITEAKRLQRAEREFSESLQNLATELEQQVEEGQSLQEELEQTNEQLADALEETRVASRKAEEANAAKSQFLATMSHELRTPLNAIAGYVDLLDLGIHGPLTAEQRDDLRRIKRGEETLLRLIDNVLSFAKLESGRLEYRYEDVKLNEFIGHLESFIAPQMTQKRLAYHFLPCNPEVILSIDRDKIEQIMLNLLSNAVKFTDSGRIDVHCDVDDARALVRVQDTGRGMRPELLGTIFEPFVQGDRSLTRTADGTGLGLSISRELARGMDCDITVESVPGSGSTFTLMVPRNHHPGANAK
jgi:PAS domain S-box-containing protein